jgi:glycosyltransferase involved in cell wall biosynthesis
MKPKEPIISVIVPTYNRANMLVGCIDAILCQTVNDFEIVVVNDGSTDKTKEIITSYNDPRIVFFEKENGGQSSARNLGIIKSRGEYISLCDDDDRFYPDHLETLCQVLDTDNNIGLVYSDAVWIYKDGSKEPEVKYSQDFDKKSLENFNYITTQTVLFRKSYLSDIALFDESFQLRNGLEDWDFFLRLSDVCGFSHLKQITAEYVVHDGNSFHAASGYDYNYAFFHVRTRRLRYLLNKFGYLIFEQVDHMYPFHLVQCYMNNGKADQAFEIADRLYQLFYLYKQERRALPIVELVILFSLGISSFARGCQTDAADFMNRILDCPSYKNIEKPFIDFIINYVRRLKDMAFRALLVNCFLQ